MHDNNMFLIFLLLLLCCNVSANKKKEYVYTNNIPQIETPKIKQQYNIMSSNINRYQIIKKYKDPFFTSLTPSFISSLTGLYTKVILLNHKAVQESTDTQKIVSPFAMFCVLGGSCGMAYYLDNNRSLYNLISEGAGALAGMFSASLIYWLVQKII